MVNRIVVGAHYGLRDWLLQRISAIVMALYSVAFLLCFLPRLPLNFEEWHAWFAHPVGKIATLLFMLSLLLHAWVGVRDIFMDYIKPFGLRFSLQVLVILLLLVYALWAVALLWSV